MSRNLVISSFEFASVGPCNMPVINDFGMPMTRVCKLCWHFTWRRLCTLTDRPMLPPQNMWDLASLILLANGQGQGRRCRAKP
eukprot:scaffold402144_cov32-Prasinocladus_malaysianus.AAC.1